MKFCFWGCLRVYAVHHRVEAWDVVFAYEGMGIDAPICVEFLGRE